MPRVRIPKYRKHKPSKLGVVSLGGRDIYLGKYGTKESRDEYDRLVAEYLKRRGQPVPPEMVAAARVNRKHFTVVEAADKYLTWCIGHRKPVEQAHVRGMLKCLVNTYENERADAIGPRALREVRAVMVSRGWSRGYVNGQVDRVRRMYKWLSGEELIPAAVYEALKVVSGLRQGESDARETDPILPVDDKTVDLTLPHLPEIIADMVRLQRLTGMRPAEVCILRPCDIDRAGDIWLYRPATHKTQHKGRERIVPIGSKAQAVLLRYLTRDSKAYCFSPRESEAKRRIPRGRAYSPRDLADRYHSGVYRRAVHRASKAAGVTQWCPNQLRHAAATQIRKEFGLEAAQIVLGHAKADVTQIYAERDLTKGLEVARKIG